MGGDSNTTIKLSISDIRKGVVRQPARPALVFLHGDYIGAAVFLDRAEVVIGRSANADIRLYDSLASRLHAQIRTVKSEQGKGEYILCDLGSTNGTFVNGEQISAPRRLMDNDKIKIGNHILKFALLDEFDSEFQNRVYNLILHDELTGLLSSRSFFAELERELERSKENDFAFSVLMMDIDHFKAVNDRFGHLIGSQTIKQVATILRSILRDTDIVARYGGEEYVAFLPETAAEKAMIVAERIRKAIAGHPFPASLHDPKATHHITISIGIASFPKDSLNPEHLVELSDKALYRAKESGRNCVCVYSQALDEQQ